MTTHYAWRLRRSGRLAAEREGRTPMSERHDTGAAIFDPEPPAYPARWSSGHGQPTVIVQRGGRAPAWIALLLTVVLLGVVAVQSAFLLKLAHRADQQDAQLRAADDWMASAQSDLDSTSKQIAAVDQRTRGSLNSAAVANQVLPSVFRIQAGKETGAAFAFGKPATGTGTLLVTNYHVLQALVLAGSRDVTLEQDGVRGAAQIVEFDARRDLAVLRSATVYPVLTAAKTAVRPGEPVVVVGAPLGLANTVTTGVVSAIRTDVPGLAGRVIQFDAAISPGNSGGPVSNAAGQVVGVAQAKIVATGADGLALAIPISQVCETLVAC